MINKVKERFNSFRKYLKEHKKARIALIVVSVIIAIGGLQAYSNAQERAKVQAELDKEASEAVEVQEQEEMSVLDEEQYTLQQKFGDPGQGYAWTDDGEKRAQGDTNLKPEDVAYRYMQGLTKLQFDQVEKYAYPSTIIASFERLFDSKGEYDSTVQFKGAVWKQVLSSMEILGIDNVITTANNKMVYTFNIRVLDLSYKTFWQEDKDKIFEDLKETTVREGDQTKIRNYLYDYVTTYYQSENPEMRTSKVNIILEKTQASGWIVVQDAEINALAQYADDDINAGVVGKIIEEFQDWYQEIEGVKPNYDNSNINEDEDISGREIEDTDTETTE